MIQNSTKLFDFLSDRLKNELPGAKAQIKMAPFNDLERLNNNIPRPNSKKSAVMILINEKLELLFTLRSSSLRNHSGQISFPGGRSENSETYEQTALRETEEEIGLPQSEIRLLGRLSNLYVPPSDNIIQPIIGCIDSNVRLHTNPAEVEEAFYVDMDYFLDEKNIQIKQGEYQGKPFSYPYWEVNRKTPIWGATAIIMSEFIYLVNEYRQNNS
jgi:8-oxo-dGTP pyrophosphatase MutT (NUDIX family)